MVDEFEDNNAASNRWLVIFPGDLKLVCKSTTNFDLPGMSTNPTFGPRSGGVLPGLFQADTITIDPISFSFIVDENYENYIELITKFFLGPLQNSSNYDFDVYFVPLSNTGREIEPEFHYIGCQITSIGVLSYDTVASIKSMSCTCTIQPSHFRMMRGEVVLLQTF